MELETWYVLTDGSVGDPRYISHGKDGRLRHKDGRFVEYGPYGPRSRGGVDPDKERAKSKPRAPDGSEDSPGVPRTKVESKAIERDWTKPAKTEPAKSDREVKAGESKATYKTR